MKKIFLSLLLVFSFGFAKPLVTTTILPTKQFVERIAGDTLDVVSLVGKGDDPHTYEPKPSQMKSVEKSELHFAVGIEFDEIWLPRLKKQFPNLEVVMTDRGVSKISSSGECHHDHHGEHAEHDHAEHHDTDDDHHNHAADHHANHEDKKAHSHESHADHHGESHKNHHANHQGESHEATHHHHHGDDPHIWTNPFLVKIQAKNIKEALVKKFPQNAEIYESNYKKFLVELDELDAFIKESLSGLKNRKFIVYHPSWGYFASRYNLEQISIEIDGKAPKPADLKELIKRAKHESIKVIFIAPQFPKNQAKVIAKESGAKVVEIDHLPENWVEEMRKTAEVFKSSLE